MKNEPVKHHYIPQFILRNYAVNTSGQVIFRDKATGKERLLDTRSIFMARNLYRDEEDFPDNPVQIEEDLARYERQISQMLRTRFLSDYDFTISRDDAEALKLFLAIMGFRALRTSVSFTGRNAVDYWKRNLSLLVNCRSLQDVLAQDGIDGAIKVFMMRDAWGLTGRFISVVESPAGEFILSDAYPVDFFGYPPNNIPTPMYSFFPISPQRAIILACKGVQAAPRDVLQVRKLVFYEPPCKEESIKIRVKKLFPEEIQYLNSAVLKEANQGCILPPGGV